MKDLGIQGIFPTPVYSCDIEREFTAQEMAFFEKQKLLTKKNIDNTFSIDSYILEKPEMAVLNLRCWRRCKDMPTASCA